MALIVEGLTFSYRGHPVLTDIFIQIPKGTFTVLLGKNGSGKSTLLKCLAGLLPFEVGRILVQGNDLRQLSLAARARHIGYLSQFHQAVFPFTVEDVVLTGRASYVYFTPGKKDKEKAEAAIRRMDLEDYRNRPYSELSGGERQLVLIARLLAQEPQIIILDEPLTHLDLPNQIKFLHLMKEFTRSGLTIVAVLHDLNSAFWHGDHFIFLKGGRVRILNQGVNPWDEALLSDVYDMPIQTVPFQERGLIVPL
jgi:iron complex transport system ATP-binding protein